MNTEPKNWGAMELRNLGTWLTQDTRIFPTCVTTSNLVVTKGVRFHFIRSYLFVFVCCTSMMLL